jgi:hypothetical protein
MPPKPKTPWIEDDIQRDTDKLRKSISEFAREYTRMGAGLGAGPGPGSGPAENKNATNDFLKQFYGILSENELGLYKQLTATQWKTAAPTTTEPDGSYIDKMTFQISEIKNSANDLPRPRILDTLRHQYDSGAGRKAAATSSSSSRSSSGGIHDHDARYIPRVVYNYIREKSEYCIRFQTTIHNRAVSLYFITFPESHISVCHGSGSGGGVSTSSVASASNYMCSTEIAMYQLYAYKVFLWLSIVTALSDKECSGKSLDVYFYMTPFKKLVPAAATATATANGPLSAIHVNTGLTRSCETNGEIVIYRTEEWFKVFIHESMHNFNMDFTDLDLSAANKRLRDTFCIPHNDILLFETYTETWARIINTMFETYFDINVRNQTEFIRHVRENISTNALFYAYQAVKVLDVMDLKYAQITILSPENMEVCHKRYTEETNVYAYYILGGILSVYALHFISWCRENNNDSSASTTTTTTISRRLSSVKSIRFSRDGGSSGVGSNLIRFVDFIRGAARDRAFLGMVAFCEKKAHAGGTGAASGAGVLQKTLRMTL